MSKITNVSEARAAIGKQVWWDEHSRRYVILRTGIVTAAQGRNIEINGQWHWRADLKDLRDTAAGGRFPEGEAKR